MQPCGPRSESVKNRSGSNSVAKRRIPLLLQATSGHSRNGPRSPPWVPPRSIFCFRVRRLRPNAPSSWSPSCSSASWSITRRSPSARSPWRRWWSCYWHRRRSFIRASRCRLRRQAISNCRNMLACNGLGLGYNGLPESYPCASATAVSPVWAADQVDLDISICQA